MRNSGTCFEVIGLRPHDHIGWVFDGPAEFYELAGRFLEDGTARRELLMLVADDPDPQAVHALSERCATDDLRVASSAEVYGASGVVDAEAQRATFMAVLDEALAEGFSGIRVAADNTPLVLDEERLHAWIRWESVADRFMSEHPVTGVCAFDRGRVDVARLRHLATLHPLISASAPSPQYRLFVDDEALWVGGLLDSSAVSEIDRALQVLSTETALVIPLDQVTLASDLVFSDLVHLSDRGTDVTFRGPPELVDAKRSSLKARERLHFVDA